MSDVEEQEKIENFKKFIAFLGDKYGNIGEIEKLSQEVMALEYSKFIALETLQRGEDLKELVEAIKGG